MRISDWSSDVCSSDLRGCARTQAISNGVVPASDSDFGTEFLDRILAVRVVDDIDQAIAHIRQHGSDHTEVIATRDNDAAERFIHALRSAVVMVNASSRFSDGGAKHGRASGGERGGT